MENFEFLQNSKLGSIIKTLWGMMKIAVSACLLGENCKYNGGNNFSQKVIEFVKGHEVVPVCPEVLGGLPVPRESAEIVDGNVIQKMETL